MSSVVRAAPEPGDRLTSFTLPQWGGGNHVWKPGRPAVLSFVAFWCDTWKEQDARLAATRRALQGLPVDFLTLSVDGRWAERGNGRVEGPVLLDTGGTFSRSLGITAVPYTVVLDATGRVAFAGQGITRAIRLQQVLRGLINADREPAAGSVYLTFDDFPAGEGDEELLDLLRREGAQATFFCIGRNAAAHPELVRRAAREGHSLQIHSWAHDAADPQIERCAKLLESLTGTRPTLYRPPGSAEIREVNGGVRRLPTVNPYDYTRPGRDELVRRVLLPLRAGTVVLLHAGVSDTRAALPDILASVRRRLLPLSDL